MHVWRTYLRPGWPAVSLVAVYYKKKLFLFASKYILQSIIESLTLKKFERFEKTLFYVNIPRFIIRNN